MGAAVEMLFGHSPSGPDYTPNRQWHVFWVRAGKSVALPVALLVVELHPNGLHRQIVGVHHHGMPSFMTTNAAPFMLALARCVSQLRCSPSGGHRSSTRMPCRSVYRPRPTWDSWTAAVSSFTTSVAR